MKIVRNMLFIILAFLVQSVAVGRFDLFGVRPDLALLVLLFIAAETGGAELIVYGFIIGFVQDVYTPEFLGYNALAMSLAAYLLSTARERIAMEHFPVRMSVFLAVCLIHDFVYLGLYAQFNYALMTRLFVTSAIPGAVVTIVLAVGMVKVWSWLVSGGAVHAVRELLGG